MKLNLTIISYIQLNEAKYSVLYVIIKNKSILNLEYNLNKKIK